MSPRTVASPPGSPAAQHHHRRTARPQLTLYVGPELTECVEQVLNWPLAHAGVAVEPEEALADREHRREEADRGATVADVEIERSACRFRQVCATTLSGGLRPPLASQVPLILMVAEDSSESTRSPKRRSDSTIARVSSLSSAPVSVDSSSASAAQMRARFVMLLEPGDVYGAADRPARTDFDAVCSRYGHDVRVVVLLVSARCSLCCLTIRRNDNAGCIAAGRPTDIKMLLFLAFLEIESRGREPVS